MKNVLKYTITFIIIIISFNIFLLLSSLFPSSLIEKNVKKSSEILLKEGNTLVIKRKKYSNITSNNYTDSIMINACYSIDNKNPIFSYMSARKNYKKGLTTEELQDTNGELVSYSSKTVDEKYDPVTELSEFLNFNVTTSIEYARYWHGYMVFLRFLLLFLDIKGIRLLLLYLFIILLIIFLPLAWRKIGKINTIIIVFSLLAYDYLYVFYSLESSPIFLTMMISSIILLIKIDKIKDIYWYFLIVGCISNFVDFLTVPTITLDMSLFIYILYKQRNNEIDLKQGVKTIIFASLIWGLGYGLTWLSKWIIYDVIYHKNLLRSAISQVVYRSSSINPVKKYKTIYDVLFQLFTINFKYIRDFIIFIISILVIILFFSRKKYEIKFNINKIYIKEVIPIIIISLIPIIWYRVLSNHTILHDHFTYRHMLIVLIGELI